MLLCESFCQHHQPSDRALVDWERQDFEHGAEGSWISA